MENIDTYFQILLNDINVYLQTLWETITFEFVFKFWLIYFFVIWIALLVWVVKDISIRTDSIFFQVISVFIILFLTPFWVFIYLIIRPRKTLYEKYYDEIEDNLDIFYELIEERKKELKIIKNDKKETNKGKKIGVILTENKDILEIKNDHKSQEENIIKEKISKKIETVRSSIKDNVITKLIKEENK